MYIEFLVLKVALHERKKGERKSQFEQVLLCVYTKNTFDTVRNVSVLMLLTSCCTDVAFSIVYIFFILRRFGGLVSPRSDDAISI